MGKGIPLTQPDGSIPARMFWRVQIEDIDSDGDGATNRQEYEANTNPNDPSDFPPEIYTITRISHQQICEGEGDFTSFNGISCWGQ